MGITWFVFLTVASLLGVSRGDYQCVCNYNIEIDVLDSPNLGATPIGHMYEFDCKPRYQGAAHTGYLGIQFEGKVGYVQTGAKIQTQVCQGTSLTTDLNTSRMTLDMQRNIISNPLFVFTESSTTLMSTPTTTPIRTTTITPALQYIGVGYNLLYGNPDGNTHRTAHIDEGFKLNSRILELSGGANPPETEYTHRTSTCTPVKTASILFDGRSYQDQLRTIVTPSNTHSSDLIASAFTLSAEFQDMYPHIAATTQPNIYRDVTTTCEVSQARYKTEEVPNGLFSVTHEFVVSLCQLPGAFDSVAYSKFLEKWGTSIVVSSRFGQRTTERYKISQLDAFNHVETQAPGRVHQTGAYLGHGSSLTVDTVNFTETQSAVSQRFGTLISTIKAGGPDDSVPIGGRIVPLTFAMDPNLWTKVTEHSIIADLCPTTFDLTTMKANLDKALKAYSSYTHAPTLTRIQYRKLSTPFAHEELLLEERWHKEERAFHYKDEKTLALKKTNILTLWCNTLTSNHLRQP